MEKNKNKTRKNIRGRRKLSYKSRKNKKKGGSPDINILIIGQHGGEDYHSQDINKCRNFFSNYFKSHSNNIKLFFVDEQQSGDTTVMEDTNGEKYVKNDIKSYLEEVPNNSISGILFDWGTIDKIKFKAQLFNDIFYKKLKDNGVIFSPGMKEFNDPIDIEYYEIDIDKKDEDNEAKLMYIEEKSGEKFIFVNIIKENIIFEGFRIKREENKILSFYLPQTTNIEKLLNSIDYVYNLTTEDPQMRDQSINEKKYSNNLSVTKQNNRNEIEYNNRDTLEHLLNKGENNDEKVNFYLPATETNNDLFFTLEISDKFNYKIMDTGYPLTMYDNKYTILTKKHISRKKREKKTNKKTLKTPSPSPFYSEKKNQKYQEERKEQRKTRRYTKTR